MYIITLYYTMWSKQIYAKVLLRVRRLTLKYSRVILLWEVTSFTLFV